MTDVPIGKRTYRDLLSDNLDQALFFGLFAAGTVSIWLLKSYGVSQFGATAFPVALILLYAAIALVAKRYRIREDRVGDNCYYLGFLYTLVSLAYALHAYDPSGAGAADIITNFGIAIFTTIIGLALRVLFNQMREDPVEYEREARYSLAEASRELRARLSDIATDVSDFQRKIAQITEEGVVDIVNSANSKMKETVQEFFSSAEKVMGQIQSAFASFTDHSCRLNEIASRNVEALHALFDRIERIEASPGLLSSKLDPTFKKLDELADEISRRNRAQTNDLKRVREMIETALNAADALQKTTQSADKVLEGGVRKFSENLGHVQTALTGAVTTLATATENWKASIEFAKASSHGLEASISAQLESIQDLRSALTSELQVLSQHRTEIATLARESRDAVETVQAGLVSLSKTVVEQLRAN